MGKKKKIPVDGSGETVRNTVLGDLLRESGLASGTPPAKEIEISKEKNPGLADAGSLPDLSRAGKIVLRVQRKGRGGKTVTVLSCSGLGKNQMEPLAKALRKGLGCGSRLEEDGIVLQGDVSERAAGWLGSHGAKHIVGGS